MSTTIKILGGTPVAGKSLCATCKYASHVRGQNCEERTVCKAGIFDSGGYDGRVPFRVAECSKYHPSNMPWLHEMEQMAWKIEARKRGPVGFEPAPGEDTMEVIVTAPKKPMEDYDD
jgi:hypothetical protein